MKKRRYYPRSCLQLPLVSAITAYLDGLHFSTQIRANLLNTQPKKNHACLVTLPPPAFFFIDGKNLPRTRQSGEIVSVPDDQGGAQQHGEPRD